MIIKEVSPNQIDVIHDYYEAPDGHKRMPMDEAGTAKLNELRAILLKKGAGVTIRHLPEGTNLGGSPHVV